MRLSVIFLIILLIVLGAARGTARHGPAQAEVGDEHAADQEHHGSHQPALAAAQGLEHPGNSSLGAPRAARTEKIARVGRRSRRRLRVCARAGNLRPGPSSRPAVACPGPRLLAFPTVPPSLRRFRKFQHLEVELQERNRPVVPRTDAPDRNGVLLPASME